MGRALQDDLSDIFPGTSEMARVMRTHDWASTSLGDPRAWPDALKIPLRMLLTSRFAMRIGWGPDLNLFYNDSYIPTLGLRHPDMLGRAFREAWPEAYDQVADQVERVRNGESTWNKALLLVLERSGYPEETYQSFSYSPLFQADGSVGGLLCVVSEETRSIISERRLETLRGLGMALSGATDKASFHAAAHAAFATNRRDFPFMALQLDDDATVYEDAAMFEKAGLSVPGSFSAAGQIIKLPTDIDWPTGAWDRPPRNAVAITIPGLGGAPVAGSLLLGLNPYQGEDVEILKLVRLLAGQIGGIYSNMSAWQAERRRADHIWSVSRDLMIVVDAEGFFRTISPSWTRILGHPIEQVIGSHFRDFVHPDDIISSGEALAEAVGEQDLSNYENRFRASDGSYRRIEWHTKLEDGLVYAYGRDVTDRRRVEEALSESQAQFRHLIQGVTDYAIYMLDLEGRVSSWNEGARRIKGYEPEEIIGQHFSRFYTHEDRTAGDPARALETARQEGRFSSEGWRVRKNGERFRANVAIDTIRDDAGHPIGFAKITRDVTERHTAQRELEEAREALFQSQKMDAIGQLTGGVAHDFNNLLMAVLSSLELLRKRLPADPLSQRLLDNAVEGAQRGATLTQRMLAFARRQDLKVDRVDLPQLLSSMNDLVQRSIGPEWPILTSFPLKLPPVRADANQLEMALLNLIVNARDASPAGGPILISATTENLRDHAATHLQDGRYVRLAVKDHGTGMDAETLRRATEPFFTTKGVGKGTGLGLPMVHGMAQQIGGTFELISKAGEGTSAVLWLPMAEDIVEETAPVPTEEAKPDVALLKILAVDDDALVLMNTVALLEDLGHHVIEASSGGEALEHIQSNSEIDLLITDQAMPNMTGAELIDAVDNIRPGMPIIIASGYGEAVKSANERVIRLGKPFNQLRLAQAVAQAIDQQSLSSSV